MAPARAMALAVVTAMLTSAASCDRRVVGDGDGPTSGPITAERWAEVESFFYQLQGASAQRIGETEFDLVVTTIDVAGSSPETVPALKESPGGDKLVLAYMSIGQAEDYRFYWDPAWRNQPPSWLDASDPNWRGDHWVRYWEEGWQRIIYGTPQSYLDQIVELGFDGVYLDRVDAFRHFQQRDGRTQAAREMVQFVLELTRYARELRPGFAVFPQNAEELGLRFPRYLEAMTGIGIEDLYYSDHEAVSASVTEEREVMLRVWMESGKLVLTTDYTARPEQVADAYRRSIGNGFVPYVADRSLGRLRINPGFEPHLSPAEYDFGADAG